MTQRANATDKFDLDGPSWQRLFLLLSPIVVAYAALLALEGMAISWIDRWLPVSSFESATRAALFVTAVLTWCRLCLIGSGVWLVLRPTGARRSFTNFAVTWAFASMFVAGAILAIDLFQHTLQYGDANYSGETVRSILLTLVYAKILLVYPGVHLFFGAMDVDEDGGGLQRSWRAVSLVESIKLFCLLLLLKLTVESVVVTAISYLPFVAPFWFIPDELSRLRYFVGQGTRIVAESLGALIYVAFLVAVVRPRLRDIKNRQTRPGE